MKSDHKLIPGSKKDWVKHVHMSRKSVYEDLNDEEVTLVMEEMEYRPPLFLRNEIIPNRSLFGRRNELPNATPVQNGYTDRYPNACL